MKKISIVIPVYNEEYFISGLLRSISKLEYPLDAYEVNVVSDGCTDGTVSVVRGFPWVHLIELPKNVGRYEARRTGLWRRSIPTSCSSMLAALWSRICLLPSTDRAPG